MGKKRSKKKGIKTGKRLRIFLTLLQKSKSIQIAFAICTKILTVTIFKGFYSASNESFKFIYLDWDLVSHLQVAA